MHNQPVPDTGHVSQPPFFFQSMNRPWKVVVFSVTCAVLISAAVTYGFFDGEDLGMSLSIAIPASGIVSYIASRMIFQYADMLAAKNEELRQLNQELDSFAHTVAHDLKNPLTSVTGYANLLLLQQDTLPPDKLRTYLERVIITGDKTVEIIDSLLLLASTRKEEVVITPLDMAQIIRQAWDRMHFLIDQRQPEIDVPDHWPIVLGHAPWVEAVWSNYLSNAIKYGGTPPQIQIGAERIHQMARFWITDNGAGIAPEDQSKLFTEFSRTDRLNGHGLGLSIVQRAIERLGGEVGVESQLGHGSTFYFTLPVKR